MRDLVKIYDSDVTEKGNFLLFDSSEELCRHKLEQQIGRKDFTILHIGKFQNIVDDCIDCYIDYEFWGGK